MKFFKYLVLSVIVIAGALYFFFELFPLCDNKVVWSQELGDKSVFVFERNCGATVATATHISLLSMGERIKTSHTGNVVIAKQTAFDISFSDSGLTISAPANTKFYKQENTYMGVSIHYIEK